MPPAKTNFICLPCRITTRAPQWPQREHTCARCGGPMLDAGPHVAIPPRRKHAAWRVLGALLRSGVTFHSECGCCNDGPGYRPRTPRQYREWREAELRKGSSRPGG